MHGIDSIVNYAYLKLQNRKFTKLEIVVARTDMITRAKYTFHN